MNRLKTLKLRKVMVAIHCLLRNAEQAARPAMCLLPRWLSISPVPTSLWLKEGASEFGNEKLLNLKGLVDLWDSDEYGYSYRSVPQPFGNSDIIRSQASLLGGCSIHNGGISFLPFYLDLKRWQQLGAKGWTHADMVRFYTKLRNNITPADERHRRNIVKDWVKACDDYFQVLIIEDFNNEISRLGNLTQGCGFVSISYTPDNNCRSSASVAYIHPSCEAINIDQTSLS
ncbi:hypothetical protein CEP53_015446, partial [Fusarium sp. AF-6]